MKKALFTAVLVVAVSFGLLLIACGKKDDGDKNKVIHNTIDGKQLSFEPTSNYLNVASDAESIHFLSGETYSFRTYVINDLDGDDWWEEIAGYDCSRAIWTISSNLGKFTSTNGYIMTGAEAEFAITAAVGATGTLKIELDGMIFSFPVTIVSSIE
jgi:hypothetical protein